MPNETPEAFDAVVELYQANTTQRDPTDPRPGPLETAALFLQPEPGHQKVVLVARLDGKPAGMVSAVTLSQSGDPNQVAALWGLVKPEFRRRGVAGSLLVQLLARLKEMGQTSILIEVLDDIEREAAVGLVSKLGLTPRIEERYSRVLVPSVDNELMASWIDQAAQLAPGYRIEQWTGPAPDHLAAQWATAKASMQDGPLDDLDYTPFTRSIDEERRVDELSEAWGYRLFRTLVLAPDGEAAGMSAIHFHTERPQVVTQGDTGVVARHRGRRLGRWLKAASFRFVVASNPEMKVIETCNAESNRWMLDVNVAMGFRAHHAATAYQGPINNALAAIGSQGRQ